MSSALRPVDPTRPPGRLRRAFSALAVTRGLLFVSRHLSWKLDPLLLRLSGGRLATTFMIRTGVLETRGARTGEPRRNAVIYWPDGERVMIAASNAGRPTNPAWYHNVVAHPRVTFANVPMTAEVVEDEAERARLWAMGDRVFPAFATYRERASAAGRQIPLIRLTPAGGLDRDP